MKLSISYSILTIILSVILCTSTAINTTIDVQPVSIITHTGTHEIVQLTSNSTLTLTFNATRTSQVLILDEYDTIISHVICTSNTLVFQLFNASDIENVVSLVEQATVVTGGIQWNCTEPSQNIRSVVPYYRFVESIQVLDHSVVIGTTKAHVMDCFEAGSRIQLHVQHHAVNQTHNKQAALPNGQPTFSVSGNSTYTVTHIKTDNSASDDMTVPVSIPSCIQNNSVVTAIGSTNNFTLQSKHGGHSSANHFTLDSTISSVGINGGNEIYRGQSYGISWYYGSGCSPLSLTYAYTDPEQAAAFFLGVSFSSTITTNQNCEYIYYWNVPTSQQESTGGLVPIQLYIQACNSQGCSTSGGINVGPEESISGVVDLNTMTGLQAASCAVDNGLTYGATVWQAGTTQYLAWYYMFGIGTISIYYSDQTQRDNGIWVPIVTGHSITTTYEWSLPWNMLTGSGQSCTIQLLFVPDVDSTGSYTTGEFIVTPPAPIQLTEQPKESAQFNVGDTITLGWTASNYPYSTLIKIVTHCTVTDNANWFTGLEQSIANLFASDINVASTYTGYGGIDITVTQAMVRDCEMVFRLEYGDFSVDSTKFGIPNTINIYTPILGQSYKPGNTIEFQWAASNVASNTAVTGILYNGLVPFGGDVIQAFTNTPITEQSTTAGAGYISFTLPNTGSILPYHLELTWNCAITLLNQGYFCASANSNEFMVPSNDPGSYNYDGSSHAASEPITLMNVTCDSLQCDSCTDLCSPICKLCETGESFEIGVICTDCYSRYDIMVSEFSIGKTDAGIELDLQVSGTGTINIDLEVLIDYSFDYEHPPILLGQIPIPITGSTVIIAGVSLGFDINLEILMDYGINFSATGNITTGMNGTIQFAASYNNVGTSLPSPLEADIQLNLVEHPLTAQLDANVSLNVGLIPNISLSILSLATVSTWTTAYLEWNSTFSYPPFAALNGEYNDTLIVDSHGNMEPPPFYYGACNTSHYAEYAIFGGARDSTVQALVSFDPLKIDVSWFGSMPLPGVGPYPIVSGCLFEAATGSSNNTDTQTQTSMILSTLPASYSLTDPTDLSVLFNVLSADISTALGIPSYRVQILTIQPVSDIKQQSSSVLQRYGYHIDAASGSGYEVNMVILPDSYDSSSTGITAQQAVSNLAAQESDSSSALYGSYISSYIDSSQYIVPATTPATASTSASATTPTTASNSPYSISGSQDISSSGSNTSTSLSSVPITIIAGAASGTVAVGILIVLLVYIRQRRKSESKQHQFDVNQPAQQVINAVVLPAEQLYQPTAILPDQTQYVKAATLVNPSAPLQVNENITA